MTEHAASGRVPPKGPAGLSGAGFDRESPADDLRVAADRRRAVLAQGVILLPSRFQRI
jgi:hypothetical protein